MSPSRPTAPTEQFFFDDEPIEAVLYGQPSPGPSNASVFIGAYKELDAVTESVATGELAAALAKMERLLCVKTPVPLLACAEFCSALADLIPVCPRPVLPEAAAGAVPVLRALIALAERYEQSALQLNAATLLYRWHEGRAEYEQARMVLAPMQARAKAKGDDRLFAILMSNYGYEFLLEGNPAEAETYFLRAAEYFEEMEIGIEIVNARANVLTCRFAQSSPKEWKGLTLELTETNRILSELGDWRVRKTLRLLAEMAWARGRSAAALEWARRAAVASSNVPTQLHQEDVHYFERLVENRLSERKHRDQGELFGDPNRSCP